MRVNVFFLEFNNHNHEISKHHFARFLHNILVKTINKNQKFTTKLHINQQISGIKPKTY